MFTGLVQKLGTLASRRPRGEGLAFVIRHEAWDTPLTLGESVAVQGVCLTVTAVGAGDFTCDVLGETLSKTNLGRREIGAAVNLERALRMDERLGGHMVTGHIDGPGTVTAVERQSNDWVLEVQAADELVSGLVMKGSVAIDGVSLTIAGLRQASFGVHLIPHTWTHTSLHTLRRGAIVNLECDILGKYVQRHLTRLHAGGGVTFEKLRAAGFGQ